MNPLECLPSFFGLYILDFFLSENLIFENYCLFTLCFVYISRMDESKERRNGRHSNGPYGLNGLAGYPLSPICRKCNSIYRMVRSVQRRRTNMVCSNATFSNASPSTWFSEFLFETDASTRFHHFTAQKRLMPHVDTNSRRSSFPFIQCCIGNVWLDLARACACWNPVRHTH